MKRFRKQTDRIAYYEALYDTITEAVRGDPDAQTLDGLRGAIGELSEYYGSRMWKKDFADDEAGKLPPTLKRGVLSEDGVYDLLERINELKKETEKMMEEQTILITVKTRGEKCEMSDDEIVEWYKTHIEKLFDPAYGTPEISVKLTRKEY